MASAEKMADTMLPDTTEKLSQLLGVESNERKLVSRVFIQALLIGLQNLFTRTAVFAIFLETLSASELPTIYIVAGLILPIFGTTFSRYAKTHSSLKAYRLSLALTICMLVGMRFSLDVLESSYLSIVALPIFYLITFRLLSMSLWGTANAVFTLRQSKRLYGLITAGDKFTTIRRGGRARPIDPSAARTRSRLSPTALSGKPTIENVGMPGAA